MRSSMLLLETCVLLAATPPTKSLSKYPKTFAPPTFASTRKPMREFSALHLSSVNRPATALLYGKLPKFVWRLVPAFVLRNVFVISMNPTGVMLAEPSFSCKGASAEASGLAAWGGGGGTTAEAGV